MNQLPNSIDEVLALINEIESKHDDDLTSTDFETLDLLAKHLEILREGA